MGITILLTRKKWNLISKVTFWSHILWILWIWERKALVQAVYCARISNFHTSLIVLRTHPKYTWVVDLLVTRMANIRALKLQNQEWRTDC